MRKKAAKKTGNLKPVKNNGAGEKMKYPRFVSLRVRLLLLVFLAAAPAMALMFYTTFNQRQFEIHQIKAGVKHLTKAIAYSQNELLHNTKQTLVVLSFLPEIQSADSKTCGAMFEKLQKHYSHYLNLEIADAGGNLVCSADTAVKRKKVSGEAWFRRTVQSGHFSSGNYQVTETGKPIVVVGHPILDSNGNIKGVIGASLDLNYLSQVAVNLGLSQGMVFNLLDRDGTVIVHYPEPEKWVGKNLSSQPLVKLILRDNEGMTEIRQADGDDHFYAFTQLGKGPAALYLSIGISKKILFAATEQLLAQVIFFHILIVALMLFLAWVGGLFILRRLAMLNHVVRNINLGNLNARTGVLSYKDELGQVAVAFDEMARSLQVRESERELASKLLTESEHRYAQLIASAPDPLVILSASGYIKTVNQAAEQISGYTAEELVGKHFAKTRIVAPPSLSKAIHEFALLLLGKERPPYEIEIICKDEAVRIFEAHSHLVKYDNSKSEVLVILRDLTERKEAEKESRLQVAALEAAANGIFITDREGMILWANSAFTRLTGYSREEIIGKNPRIFKSGSGNQTPEFYKNIWETILAGEVWRGEIVNRRKDGSLYNEEMMITPVRAFGKEVTHFIAVKQDITDHKNLEESYRQSQKMEAIGRLAGGIAHDFNNILTVLTGYTDLMLSNLPPDDSKRPDLMEIRKATDRAANLTRQLLIFSRRQIVNPQIVNLNDLILNLDKMLRRVIGENVELITIPGQPLFPVKADAGQLEQVLINLSVNARDAMPEGGKLIIETVNIHLDEDYIRVHEHSVAAGNFVMIAVSDTGCGMSAEVKKHVFEPFFTTKPKDKGTGLGLATCYGIVKQMKGFIWFYSEVGKGTLFKIYLPCAEGVPEALSKPEKNEPLPVGTETILLVEDEPLVRQLNARILRKQGYDVIEAMNGDDALSFIREHQKRKIHLLFTDIVMPGINGTELAERIKEISPNIKTLFTSGYTDETVLRYGVLESRLAFLQKPISPQMLVRKIREILDH